MVVGPALLWSQFQTDENGDWREAVTGTVAALVGMIPEGLVLLTSAGLHGRDRDAGPPADPGAGAARGRGAGPRRRRLPGQDRHPHPRRRPVRPAGAAAGRRRPGDGAAPALGLLVAADDANATAAALRRGLPGAGDGAPVAAVPFSSARKWSAVRTAAARHLGARRAGDGAARPRDAGAADAARGTVRRAGRRRAAASCCWRAAPSRRCGETGAGAARRPRPRSRSWCWPSGYATDAAETLRYFTEQGVALKVISGDNPRTVGVVAAAVGVPGVTGADDAVDARTLPEDLDDAGRRHGRRTACSAGSPRSRSGPMVAALQKRGHVVAMTGDGVNDALALKDADIGVAMGNGSAATRAVAQLVLLDGKFSHLPDGVAEGRRVIANIERAANLFLVKNVYSLVLALSSPCVTARPIRWSRSS